MNNHEAIKLFAETKLETSPKTFSIVSIPVKYLESLMKILPTDGDFLSLTKDRNDEISLIIETDKWKSLDKGSIHSACSDNWRLFSFYSEGLIEIVGYLAKICVLLAQNNINLMAFSTYQKSHLMVKEADYNKTQAILKIFLNQTIK